MNKSKVMSMSDAIRQFVHDGDTVMIEGFTHLICFAAGHEIIRQRKKNLTLCRLTPDLVYDQMIAAGCARKLVFSWAGNPGVGPLHALRRAVEQKKPHPIEIDEYSHFGMAMRVYAAAAKLPFMPLRSYRGSDLPKVNPNIRTVTCPFTGEELNAVPALHPDVAVIHAQRATPMATRKFGACWACKRKRPLQQNVSSSLSKNWLTNKSFAPIPTAP